MSLLLFGSSIKQSDQTEEAVEEQQQTNILLKVHLTNVFMTFDASTLYGRSLTQYTEIQAEIWAEIQAIISRGAALSHGSASSPTANTVT